MRRKFNEENERIKRQYLHFLREAKRCDNATVDKAADAILAFERSSGFKSFKVFKIEQAVAFKRQLETGRSKRTGNALAKSTIDGTLRGVKAFVLWLAGQPGYKSRISYSDAEYFNLNAKDARIAHADRESAFPTLQQCRHAFSLMPENSDVERRNKAMFAFLMLTGIRDGAMASLRLKRIDMSDRCVNQDPRDVKTKFAKTFTTWFFPVDPIYEQYFAGWISHLQQKLLFGPEDACFPKTIIEPLNGSYAVVGLSRTPYSSAAKVRKTIRSAFISAGLPAFAPHSFRKTLVILGVNACKTQEEFKAWSLNLGHDSVITTISSYCPVSTQRQRELIQAM